MIKTNQKISIKEEVIFANDLLDRKEAIDDLSKLIKNQKEPLVLSINADWGAGKTTFVKLWQAYLKAEKVESIYFSAWENDFSDEPLVAILGEFDIYIENIKQDKTKTAFKTTKKLAEKILPTLVNFVAGEAAEKTTQAIIDNYKTNKTDLEKLKESIGEVLKTINSDKPFVIFIDELDRCKPLYAIELLERIKHIFDIERLIFVLSVDKNNLAESIKSQYGNIDTDNYLRRFINLEYPLKNPSVDKFCAALYSKFDFSKILNSKDVSADNMYDLDFIQKLSVSFELSLRQIEQIFTKLHIFYNTISIRFRPMHLTIFILFECLKSNDSKQYYDFLAGKVSTETIEDIVFTQNFKYKNSFIKAIIDITPLRNDSEALNIFIGKQDEHFIKFVKHGSHGYYLVDFIKTVIKHIDFAERFDFSTNEKK